MQIRTAQREVENFHKHHEYPTSIDNPQPMVDDELRDVAADLQNLVAAYMDTAVRYQDAGDPRLYRLCLNMEELAEQYDAEANHDEVAVADALGDRQFVLLGDCVTHGMELEEIFKAVAISNATKKIRSEDDPRMRDKGEHYQPPDIKAALEAGQRRRDFERKLDNERL